MSSSNQGTVQPKKPNQITGFKVGNDLYGIDVLEVQEVIKPQTITPIPKSEKYIKGLINLRGQIVTSISLRKLFGIDEPEGEEHMNVIVKKGDHLFALTVDEILDVMDLVEENFESTPKNLDLNLKKYAQFVYKLDNKLVTLLSLEKILSQ